MQLGFQKQRSQKNVSHQNRLPTMTSQRLLSRNSPINAKKLRES